MRALTKKTICALADLVFPRSCIHCAGVVHPNKNDFEYLCTNCSKELHLCTPPACMTCGYPFYGAVIGPRTCPHCVELNPCYAYGKSVFLTQGPGRSILHNLKYQSGFYVLQDIGRMIRDTTHLSHYFKDAYLVPVPLHPDKERERGYNQSMLIAQTLAENSPVKGIQSLLERTRFTSSQTQLNRKERDQNVKNAFALSQRTHVMTDSIYILVDDVFTTGSTLNACALALQNAGAKHLKVFTLGHG